MIIAGIAILALASKTASGAASGNLDISYFSDQYGSDVAARISALYSELLSRGLTNQQILFALSQMLQESGLLTDMANYNLMDNNNYAGLTTTSGGYAAYNSISAFIDAYLGFVTKGSDPIAAGSLSDFNNRLVANHYYTANPADYLKRLTSYYNLLNSNLA